MGWLDKIKSIGGLIGGGAKAASNPVSAVAGAVEGIAGAVSAGEQLADHKQMLAAGAAEGVQKDAAKTEERIADAAAARNDSGLRADVQRARYRD